MGDADGQDRSAMLEAELKKWNWGAFGLPFLWAIFNRTWVGLLVLIPVLGFILRIVLGVKGNQWAWRNKKWDSIEHFRAVQKKWAIAAGIFWGLVLAIGLIAVVFGGSATPK